MKHLVPRLASRSSVPSVARLSVEDGPGMGAPGLLGGRPPRHGVGWCSEAELPCTRRGLASFVALGLGSRPCGLGLWPRSCPAHRCRALSLASVCMQQVSGGGASGWTDARAEVLGLIATCCPPARRSRSPPSATGTRCHRRGWGRPSPPASPSSPSPSLRSQR